MPYLIIFLALLGNLFLFWLYYARTKRLLYRQIDESTRLFFRLEQRMSKMFREELISSGSNVWAVVFSYDRLEMLRLTLESLRKQEPTIKILVIDNGSKDGTQRYLTELLQSGVVNKVLFNIHTEVPQWQKGFAIHQAVKLLSLERVSHFTFLDDDIEVAMPFVEHGERILSELHSRKVRLVSFMTDDVQDSVHATLENVNVGGVNVKIKDSFNGAFLFVEAGYFREFGLPPVEEGTDVISMEDWYYSRLFKSTGSFAACVDGARHMGGHISKRVEAEQAQALRS